MTPVRRAEDSAATVFFMTLGCPKNEVDTDRMHALLDASQHRVTNDFEQADVVVLNTCGFIEDAVSESIDTTLELARWRDAGDGRALVITGCMVSRYGENLQGELSEPDAYLSVADEPEIVSLIDHLGGFSSSPDSNAPERGLATVRTQGGHSAYLQVSDGCFRDCSFCTIPSIRGPYRSRSTSSLHLEAQHLVDGGAREIVLIGQDISAWGRDLPGDEQIADVVSDLATIEDLAWLRLMYVQPDGITDALLETIAASDNVVEYLDMPLQHVSASVLRAMNRSGSAESFLSLLDRVRSAVPGIALRTTFIAGFPGESEADLNELVDFIGKAQFDYAGVFPYSPEDGTAAATLPGLPSAEERLARAQRVRDAADEASINHLDERVGQVLEVMADRVDEEGSAMGRLRMQAPDVDGVVYLDRTLAPGTICRARIVDSLGYDLEGTITIC